VGRIVPALYQPERKVLLVGQAPGADGDLRPLTGTMGLRLAEMAGYDPADGDEAIGRWFSRANVLDYFPGKDETGKGHLFPIGHGRVAAAKMWPSLRDYERVLFCGRAVFECFRTCAYGDVNEWRKAWKDCEPLTWHDEFPSRPRLVFARMPHTSMVVPWWNDEANVLRASEFLRELLDWTTEKAVA
jgi:uracil-DNA glycosylase